MKTHILTLLAASLVASGLAAATETVTSDPIPVVFATLESVTVDDVDEDGNVTSTVTYYTSSGGAATDVEVSSATEGSIEYLKIEDVTEDGHLAENKSLWDSTLDTTVRPVQIPTYITISLDLDTLVDALNQGYISGSFAFLLLDFEYTDTSTLEGTAETGVGLYLQQASDGSYQLSFLAANSSTSSASAWTGSYTPVTLITCTDGTYEISSTVESCVDEDGNIQVSYYVEHTTSETSDGTGTGTTVTLSIGDDTESSVTLSGVRYGSRFNTALESVTLATTYYYTTTYTIPEPATATLSLLALAGLAARRRRK